MISVRGLHKHYEVHARAAGFGAAVRSLFRREMKTVRAVDGIDFEIAEGERVGFLGPNGAGKTTTLKVLAGLLHPTSGHVRVDGHEPRRRAEAFLRAITLVLGQKQQLLWDLPPADTFELNRAIYGIDRATHARSLGELVQLLEIGDVISRPTRQLSLGERMKCELVAALVHRPKLLFLDEPTIGLDVAMQVTLREFIRTYNEQHGATIILTSHNMADVASLSPRVILIDHGKLAYDGSLAGLVHRTRPEKRIVLHLADKAPPAELAAVGAVLQRDGKTAVITVPQREVGRIVAQAIATLSIVDLEVGDPPLEEVMAQLFGGTAREAQH